MNREEVTKTFEIEKNSLVSIVYTKYSSALTVKLNMKQIHGAVQALKSDNRILAIILDFFKETKKHNKNTRQIPQGQYAY